MQHEHPKAVYFAFRTAAVVHTAIARGVGQKLPRHIGTSKHGAAPCDGGKAGDACNESECQPYAQMCRAVHVGNSEQLLIQAVGSLRNAKHHDSSTAHVL